MSSQQSLSDSLNLSPLSSRSPPDFDSASASPYQNHSEKASRYQDTRNFQSTKCLFQESDCRMHTAVDKEKRGKPEEFYEHVDERMSRNSLEYPEHQAAQVRYWLERNGDQLSDNMDDGEKQPGNVIGIRGFPKSSSDATSHGNFEAKYKQQIRENMRLKTCLSELIKRLETAEAKRIAHQPLVSPTALVKFSKRLCDRCGSSVHDQTQLVSAEVVSLKAELKELNRELWQRDVQLNNMTALKDEQIANAQKTINEREKELDDLKKRLKAPPTTDTVAQYPCGALAALEECEKYRGAYRHLESQLESLEKDQCRLEEERDDEVSRLTVELCRLQVHQAKLELLLDTERKIKQELQVKVDEAEQTRAKLEDQLAGLRRELNSEKMRTMKNESVELDRLRSELLRVQENCHRIEREKGEIDELLRASKSRLVSLDAKHQSELDQIRDAAKLEVESHRIVSVKLKEERDKFAAHLARLENQVADLESDKLVLTNDLLELNRKLALANATSDMDKAKAKRVEELDKRLADISDRLRASELKNGQLTDELGENKSQAERARQQVDQLQQRFHLQQRALVELREKKDKELARLRTSLNFEQYNRQVALKGIEKELRASLRDLEAMKCRFSQRFVARRDSNGKKEQQQQSKIEASPVAGKTAVSAAKHCCSPMTSGRAKSGVGAASAGQ